MNYLKKKLFMIFLGLMLINVSVYAESNIIGRKFYSRASLWSQDGLINSVNYKRGQIIPVGTLVQVLDITSEYIKFIILGKEDEYILEIDPRMSSLSTEQLFRRYFDLISPEKSGIFKVFNEKEIKAIMEGRVEKGMSKAALIMAYGYPPSHKTNVDKDNTWTYWISPSQIQVLTFVDGSLNNIYPTPEGEASEEEEMPNVKVDIKFFDQFDNEILRKKREKAKEKYRIIPSELSYTTVLENEQELEVLNLDKVVEDLPLGGSITDVGFWCREQGVAQIDDIDLNTLKRQIFDLIIPVGVEKDKLGKWGYGAIAHAISNDKDRLNHNEEDIKKAKVLFETFSNPKLVYSAQTYFLTPFASLKYGHKLAQERFTLTVRNSPEFEIDGINKVRFYFKRKFDDYILYAVEVFFASNPVEYVELFDEKFMAHKLIPGDKELGVKKWFDEHMSKLLIDPVPTDLLSYAWGKNLFLIPDETLLEYSSDNIEFYRTRLFGAYFLNSIGLKHRSHYKVLFLDSKIIDEVIADAD